MKISIVYNTGKSLAKKLVQKYAVQFLAQGNTVFMMKEEAIAIGMSELSSSLDKMTDSDIVVVFGGDGTILRAVRELEGTRAAFLGVNLGKLGFMATIQPEKFDEISKSLSTEKFKIKTRRLIKWQALFDGKVIDEGEALNELCVGRGGRQRSASIDLSINNHHFLKYSADGLIVASPSGSTAYSLSAGGPIVSSDCEALILSPICPHTIFSRSIVTGPKDEIRITFDKKLKVLIDGQKTVVKKLDSIKVKLSDRRVGFIALNDDNFYTALKEKLRLNELIG